MPQIRGSAKWLTNVKKEVEPKNLVRIDHSSVKLTNRKIGSALESSLDRIHDEEYRRKADVEHKIKTTRNEVELWTRMRALMTITELDFLKRKDSRPKTATPALKQTTKTTTSKAAVSVQEPDKYHGNVKVVTQPSATAQSNQEQNALQEQRTSLRPRTAPVRVPGRSYQELREISHIDSRSTNNKNNEKLEKKEKQRQVIREHNEVLQQRIHCFYKTLDDVKPPRHDGCTIVWGKRIKPFV